jgi:hypothetical protein
MTPDVSSGLPRHVHQEFESSASRPRHHHRHDRRCGSVDPRDPGCRRPGDDHHGGAGDAGHGGSGRVRRVGGSQAAVASFCGWRGMRLRARLPDPRNVPRRCVWPAAGAPPSPPWLCDAPAGLPPAPRLVGGRPDAHAAAAGTAPVPSVRCGDRGRALSHWLAPLRPAPWHRRHTTTPFHAVRPGITPGRTAASYYESRATISMAAVITATPNRSRATPAAIMLFSGIRPEP